MPTSPPYCRHHLLFQPVPMRCGGEDQSNERSFRPGRDRNSSQNTKGTSSGLLSSFAHGPPSTVGRRPDQAWCPTSNSLALSSRRPAPLVPLFWSGGRGCLISVWIARRPRARRARSAVIQLIIAALANRQTGRTLRKSNRINIGFLEIKHKERALLTDPVSQWSIDRRLGSPAIGRIPIGWR